VVILHRGFTILLFCAVFALNRTLIKRDETDKVTLAFV